MTVQAHKGQGYPSTAHTEPRPQRRVHHLQRLQMVRTARHHPRGWVVRQTISGPARYGSETCRANGRPDWADAVIA